MGTKDTQNLRVYARRLNTVIDEKYIQVLKGKVRIESEYWSSRTGSMLLTIANIFFINGVKGSEAYVLGSVAAHAFYNINHSTESTPNIHKEVCKAVNECKHSKVILPHEIAEIVSLLSKFYSERSKEKSRPSVVNVVVNNILRR